MHEVTLLYGMAKQIEEVVKENGIEHIDAVVLDVGEASGAIPLFLYESYEMVQEMFPFLAGSKLVVNTVTAVGQCSECGKVYPIVKNKGVCPVCGSKDKDVLEGTDFVIKELRIIEKKAGSTDSLSKEESGQ